MKLKCDSKQIILHMLSRTFEQDKFHFGHDERREKKGRVKQIDQYIE